MQKRFVKGAGPRAIGHFALGGTLAAGIAFATSAMAESTALTKAEVDALVAEKKVEYTRAADSATIGWAFSKDGTVYYTTSKSQRNIPISGTYAVQDDGSICFKWNQDKYIVLTDGCVAFTREGDKTHVVGARNKERVLGDLNK